MNPYKSFVSSKVDLRAAIEDCATEYFSLEFYKKEVKKALTQLSRAEAELAEHDAARLPDSEADALRKRAGRLINSKRKIPKTLTLSIDLSTDLINDLRIIGNTISHRAGYAKGDEIDPEAAASLILEAYIKTPRHEREDLTIPFSTLKDMAEERKGQYVPTEAQRQEIDRLMLEEALGWSEARRRVLTPHNKRMGN